MTDRYNVVAVRKGRDDKNYYTRIGTAFRFREKDGYTVLFDALPVPDADGRVAVLLMPPDNGDSRRDPPSQDRRPASRPSSPSREYQREDSRDRQTARTLTDLDDDLPF